jgi:CheY-like chemotaxis protein
VNARDAMPEGGKLTIETASVMLDAEYVRGHAELTSGRHVMLAVTDTGHGMDATTKARLFEPFFTTKPVGRGTGLGLATVYGIVRQSGGGIYVYSEVGHGTTFKVYFPEIAAPRETPAGPTAPAPVSRRGTETILLVEDEAAVRQLARKILEGHGYTVLTADGGSSALTLAQRHAGTIHLLLTDVVMPELSGRDLATALDRTGGRIRVLYMSGYTDDTIIRHGVLEAGVAYLQKPFTPEALLRKVREVLDAGG